MSLELRQDGHKTIKGNAGNNVIRPDRCVVHDRPHFIPTKLGKQAKQAQGDCNYQQPPSGYVRNHIMSTDHKVPPVNDTLNVAKMQCRRNFNKTDYREQVTFKNTNIVISREDPSQVKADVIINFIDPKLKPIGPVSRNLQKSAGDDYKQAIKKNLSQEGELEVSENRLFSGRKLNSLWVLNVHLPKYKMNTQISSTLVYRAIVKTLMTVCDNNHKVVLLSPTDIPCLGYSEAKVLRIILQALWKVTHTSQNTLTKVFMPVQTPHTAQHLVHLSQKLLKGEKIFEERPVVPEGTNTGKMQRADKYVTDPQQIAKDISAKPGDLDIDFDKVDLGKMQENDPNFKPMIDYLKKGILPLDNKRAKKLKREASSYDLFGGYLYHLWVIPGQNSIEHRARFQFCVPQNLQSHLMYVYHDIPLAAHRSAEKMYTAIRMHYFWPGMFLHIQIGRLIAFEWIHLDDMIVVMKESSLLWVALSQFKLNALRECGDRRMDHTYQAS